MTGLRGGVDALELNEDDDAATVLVEKGDVTIIATARSGSNPEDLAEALNETEAQLELSEYHRENTQNPNRLRADGGKVIANQRLVRDLDPDTEIAHSRRTYGAPRAHFDDGCNKLKGEPLGPKPARSWNQGALVCVYCDPEVVYNAGEVQDDPDRTVFDALSSPEVTSFDEARDVIQKQRAENGEEPA